MSRMILGTRGSDLALAQADLVQAALAAAYPQLKCTRQIIKTIGDKRPELKLTEFSSQQVVDKGIFTKELESALRDGEIDVAVHSLKDVPTELAPEFALAAVLPRESTADVLITKRPLEKGLASLSPNARVATSSVRRRALLQWRRPDIGVDEIRGNVPTRLTKLVQNADLDGVLLALAGLNRLNYQPGLNWEGTPLYFTMLEPPEFFPACGQGAVALEIRADDAETRSLLEAINHQETMTRVTAERGILERLHAGCHTPVGVHSWMDGGQLGLEVCVFDEHRLTDPPKQAAIGGEPNDLKRLLDDLMTKLHG